MRRSVRSQGPSFLSGVSILTLSALLVKVIGLIYRIPMLDLLGTEGMGYFNTAYEIYAFFCVISTYTHSPNVSRMMNFSAEGISPAILLCPV